MNEIENYSSTELVGLLGERFRAYRMRLQLTQEEVAQRTGLSISSIRRFESGRAGNLSMSSFFALLKSLGRLPQIEHLLPELPEPLYMIHDNKLRQRVKHRKK